MIELNRYVALAIARTTGLRYMTVRALASSVTPWITFADFVRMCEQEGHR